MRTNALNPAVANARSQDARPVSTNRRRAFLCVTLSLLLFPSLLATASLQIEDFAVDIVMDISGELVVTENITVLFFTPHHGIERFITISEKTPLGENVSIVLRVEEILKDGVPEPYTSRVSGNARVLRIGDPDRTITGVTRYTIRYRVQRALLFSDNAIHLYWNVTGNDWDVLINQASAHVHLPDSVDLTAVTRVSYSGYYGTSAQQHLGTVTGEGELLFESGPLYPGEGLTLLITVPREILPISPPSFWQRLVWFLSANWSASLPLVTLLGMFLLWSKRGKDPKKRVIAPAFAPPRDMHPGAAGVLIDDRMDLRDVSAMLVGLAVGGYLTIGELKDANYTFSRQKPADESLSPAEQALYDALFGTPPSETCTLASLEQKFYKSLPTIKSRVFGELIDAGYYPSNPERTRGFYRGIGGLALPLAAYLGIQSTSLILGISVALCGVVVLAFSRVMPRKTVKGVRKLEEVLGLAKYIGLAEVDRIEFHNAPDKEPQHFEKLLPYAIALNLTAIWTKQFEGLLREPPKWYTGATPTPSLNIIAFSHALSTMNRRMERTFVSAPRTSGKSASSGRSTFGGGFSGGGFSGGGFGGGGGKGW